MFEDYALTAVPRGTDYHYNLFGPVGNTEDYGELIALLRQALPEDSITLHINTPGGDLATTVQILTAMEECACPVITSADGEVYSAGGIIFFKGNGFKVSPYSSFMLHDGSGGHYGKINDNIKSAEASSEFISRIYHDVFGPFFSEQEIEQVLEGRDMWLTPEDVVERLQKATEEMEEDDTENTNS